MYFLCNNRYFQLERVELISLRVYLLYSYKMLNKLKKHIFSPINSVKKIIYTFQSLILEIYYKESVFQRKQDKIFSELGLDRNEGLKIFEIQKKERKAFETPMSSEHKVLFASISCKKNYKDILEIGTHDGKNALYLSQIFPNSKVTTIDLPEDDKLFTSSYERNSKEKRDKFCKERDKILSCSKNIFFKKMNSLELCNSKETYDLIWVDGAHGYPYVSIDITNSIRLLNENGLLICDDVWKTKPYNQDDTYHSIASYDTLMALQEAKVLKFNTIYKRLDKKNNANEKFRKFIAIVKKFCND